MSAEPSILLEISHHVATVTLHRPERLNAFNEAMHTQLAQALDRIELDRAIRAVLLRGWHPSTVFFHVEDWWNVQVFGNFLKYFRDEKIIV